LLEIAIRWDLPRRNRMRDVVFDIDRPGVVLQAFTATADINLLRWEAWRGGPSKERRASQRLPILHSTSSTFETILVQRIATLPASTRMNHYAADLCDDIQITRRKAS
jgi:hypothetical protein